jgi:hypothetical protein
MRETGSLELVPQTEMIDGVETYVLKSRGKYGEHKVWLDPASGALPRRVEIHKHAGNLLNDYQLGTEIAPDAEVPANPRRANARPAARPPGSPRWTRIDNIRIGQHDGAFVITGYEQSGGRLTLADDKNGPQQKADERPPVILKQNFQVDVDPKEFPDDAFRLSIAIPNGTRVLVADKYPIEHRGPMQLEHEWIDGKIQLRQGK